MKRIAEYIILFSIFLQPLISSAKSNTPGYLDVDDAYRTLEQQVLDGLIDESDIDNAVRRILRVKFLLGLFDKTDDDSFTTDMIHSASHVALAKEVADESAILLDNNGILPLDLNKIKSIAVVGPNADFAVMGDYSWARPDNDEGVSVFKGLKNRLSADIKINYARGHSSDDIKFSKTITL